MPVASYIQYLQLFWMREKVGIWNFRITIFTPPLIAWTREVTESWCDILLFSLAVVFCTINDGLC